MLLRPLSQPPLSVRQRNDLREDLAALFASLPEGVNVYAFKEQVPRAVASMLIGLSLNDSRLFPMGCPGLTLDSVRFLQVKFRFDGWFWLQRLGAVNQLTNVIREMIDKGELEVLRDDDIPALREGPCHIIQVTNRPIVVS